MKRYQAASMDNFSLKPVNFGEVLAIRAAINGIASDCNKRSPITQKATARMNPTIASLQTKGASECARAAAWTGLLAGPEPLDMPNRKPRLRERGGRYILTGADLVVKWNRCKSSEIVLEKTDCSREDQRSIASVVYG